MFGLEELRTGRRQLVGKDGSVRDNRKKAFRFVGNRHMKVELTASRRQVETRNHQAEREDPGDRSQTVDIEVGMKSLDLLADTQDVHLIVG